MALSGLLGLLVGGAGHIGKKLIEFGIDYFSQKQQIQLIKAQSKSPATTNNLVCKYQPCTIQSKQYGGNVALEKKEPKKFLFVIFVVLLSIVGLCTSLYFQMDLSESFSSKRDILISLERLEYFCYELIGFLVSWTLTGSVIKVKK